MPALGKGYLLESALVSSHEVGDDQTGTPADAHAAVNKNIAFCQRLLDEMIGGLEVVVNIGQGLIGNADFHVLDA